jgi:hypothetical protein
MDSVEERTKGPGYGQVLDEAQEGDLAEMEVGQSLSLEKVVTLLKKQGIDVTVEQAGSVLAFLDQLSNIIVSQYLRR